MERSLHPSELPEDALLYPGQVAEWLATTRSTLAKQRMRREGPPFRKIGRSVRYRVGDVRAWLREVGGDS